MPSVTDHESCALTRRAGDPQGPGTRDQARVLTGARGCAGRNPDARTGYSSRSEPGGVRASLGADIQQVRLRRDRLMAVSFAQDIRHLFTEMDIAHEKPRRLPDNFDHMRNQKPCSERPEQCKHRGNDRKSQQRDFIVT
jgi:hypothetical protein